MWHFSQRKRRHPAWRGACRCDVVCTRLPEVPPRLRQRAPVIAMRLLLVADLHYSLPQFDWVLDIADGFDVVVMAGDHLDLASLVDGRAQTVVVRKYFGRLRAKTRLVICSGNHDLDVKNAGGEKVAKWLGGPQQEGV